MMDKFPMCRICLVQNVRMFAVFNRNLRELYEKLTNNPLVTKDRRPMLACFFCYAKLKQCYRFQRQCLEAEELFAQTMNEDYEANPLKQDLTEFHNRFISSPIVHINIVDDSQKESLAIKQEIPAVDEGLGHVIELKEEHHCQELVLENSDNGGIHEVDIPPYHSESDSKDDVPLIEFQTEMEEDKEVYKKKQKVRDKKNPLKMQANIDVEMRANIIALRRRGLNITQISNETGVNRNTVSRWVKRHEAGDSLASRKRCGRPQLIQEAQRRYMVNEYESIGFIPTRSFAELFHTSVQTVRRALNAEGLRPRKPTQRPYLTEKHKQERLSFAREYLDFNWDTTIFSDEKALKSSRNGKLRLWRRNDTHRCEENVVPDTESGRITVNMWGWMSAAGPGELEYVPPSANSSTYVEVLRDVMLPTVRNVYPAEECNEISFIQNNCPIQRASTVREWFREHPEIKLIPWPARSHDLNPMENLWTLMIQRWKERNERSEEQLKSHCNEIWENLRGTDICSNIVGSMRQRLLDCISNNGGPIKY